MDTGTHILVIAVLGIVAVAGQEGCKIYKKGEEIGSEDGIGLLNDVGQSGEVIVEYKTSGVQSISIGKSKYLNAVLENDTLQIRFTEDYQTWEIHESYKFRDVNVSVKLHCSDSETKDILLYGYIHTFTNGYDPKFAEDRDEFRFVIPMPFPAGLSVTLNFGDDSNKMVVIDYDVNENDGTKADVTFDLEGAGSELFDIRTAEVFEKQFTAELFTAKTLQIRETLTFQLIATDNDHKPTSRSSSATIIIEPDLSTLPVAPPTFQEPLYTINVTESEDLTVEVFFEEGYDQDKTTLSLSHRSGEDLTSLFTAERSTENSAVVRGRGELPAEVLERYFGVMLLEATTEGVAEVGKTVIQVILPGSNPVTTTTTESTTTTTETTTESTTTPDTTESTADTPGSSETDPGTTESSGTDPGTTESSGTDPGTTESSETDPGTTESSGTDPGTTESSGTDPGTTESSGTDPGTTESSETDPGTTESSGTDPGTTESSGTDPGTSESSETDPGTTESSGTDPGTTESSGTDPGTTESSETDPGTTESSGTDPGTTESSGTDPGTTESSGTDPGTTESSGTDPGTTGSSGTDPGTTESSGTDPGTTESSGTDPGTTESSGTDPGTTESSGTDPGTTDSSGTDPGTTDSSGTDPGTTDSSGTDPGTTESSGTDPGTTESSETDPGTTESSGTDPGTTESSGTDPGTTESSGTDPGTTESSGTDPGTTESSGTDPGTTESSGTDPGTTDSSGTDPGTTDSSGTDPGTTESSGTDPGTTDSSGTDPGTTESSGTDPGTSESSGTDPWSSTTDTDPSSSSPTETPTTIDPPVENLWDYTVLVITLRETTATSVPLARTGITNMNCNFSLEADPSEATGLFTIDANGTVSTAAPIDRESKIFNQSNIVRLKLFRTCENPAANSKLCSGNALWDSIGPRKVEYNVTAEENAMLLVVKVEDVNDNRPFFTERSLTVGYPSEHLVMELLPPSLVTVQAVDLDIGENAKIEYLIGASRRREHDDHDDDDDDDDDHDDDDDDDDDDHDHGHDHGNEDGSTQFVVHKDTGVVYPRQRVFQYKDTSFSVMARDSVGVGGSIQINVRILQKDNMVVIYQEDSTLEDTQKVLSSLQKAAGVKDVLAISAAVVADDKQDRRRSTSVGREETHTLLRLVVYGVDDREKLVPASTILRAADKSPGVVKAEEWKASSMVAEANTGLLIPVIILGVLLLISAVTMAFLLYRLRQSKESGLTALSKGANSSYPVPWWKKPKMMRKCFGSSYEAFSGTSSNQGSVSSVHAEIPNNSKNDIQMTTLNIEKETTVVDGASSDSNRSSVNIGNAAGESDDSVSQDDGKGSLARRKSLVTFNENVEQIEIEKL